MESRREVLPRWTTRETLVRVTALIIPWGLIEQEFVSRGHPQLGYGVGLCVGLFCMYIVPPRDSPLWRYGVAWMICVAVRLVTQLGFRTG